MKLMKIGELAKLTGTSIETIRFYEREALLLEPDRRASGYRQYDSTTVERLGYIKRAKELGFTLSEIRELLELSFAETSCQHIQRRAEAKLADMESKIRNLRQMKRSLERIVGRCRNENSPISCPLVHKTNKASKK